MKWKVSVRPNVLVASYSGGRRGNSILQQWRKIPVKREHNGLLSPNARRKLQRAIKWLVVASEVKKVFEKKSNGMVDWRISIGTLTFRNLMEDDKAARALLSKWFEMAYHRWGIEQYIWKAEPQARGSIHFHVLLNKHVPYKEFYHTWCRLLVKNGYPAVSSAGTDIHAVTNAENIESYLTGYMCNEEKHEGRRAIKGRLWGCSRALSQAGKEYEVIDKDELVVMSDELYRISLAKVLADKGYPEPKWLACTGVWLTGESWYKALPDCDIKNLWLHELAKLNVKHEVPDLFRSMPTRPVKSVITPAAVVPVQSALDL